MEGLLQGIPYTGVLLDNILITGPTDEDHLANLEAVFKRLSNAGLRLKAKNHRVDKEGFYPVEAKVQAIKDERHQPMSLN